MPRIDDAVADTYRDDARVDRADAVSLDKDEVARLWVPDRKFWWMEWTHTVRVPVFEAETGKPLMGQRETKVGFKDVYKTDFLGRRICTGDPDVLAHKGGFDTGGCLQCALVQKMIDEGISDALDMRSQRRFAIPVVRYNTVRKNDVKLQTPYGGKILVLGAAQYVYNKLDDVKADIAELLELDLEKVSLSHADIKAVCENTFKVPTAFSPLRCAWRHPSEAGQAVKAVIQPLWGNPENRPSDAQLRASCGREPDPEWMRRDMEDAAERWHRALNYGKASPTGSGVLSNGHRPQNLDDGLDDLDGPPASPGDPLDGHPGGLDEFASHPAPPASDDPFGDDRAPSNGKVPAASASVPDDMFGEDTPAPRPPAPAPVAAATANGSGGDDKTFDDLMADLDI